MSKDDPFAPIQRIQRVLAPFGGPVKKNEAERVKEIRNETDLYAEKRNIDYQYESRLERVRQEERVEAHRRMKEIDLEFEEKRLKIFEELTQIQARAAREENKENRKRLQEQADFFQARYEELRRLMES